MKLGRFIFGVGVGVVAGILCAPKKGSEMVKEIKDTSKKAYDKSKNLTLYDDIEDEFDEELDDVNKEIDDLLDEIEEDEESKKD